MEILIINHYYYYYYTLFLVYVNFFHEKTDKKHENTRSPPFLYDMKMHGRLQLLGVQSIDPERASLKQFCQSDCTYTYTVHVTVAELLTLCLYLNFRTEDHIRLQGSSM